MLDPEQRIEFICVAGPAGAHPELLQMLYLKPLLPFLLWAFQAGPGHPHPSLPPSGVPEGLGVNIHFTRPRPGEMHMLAEAGFRWVRMDFSWAATERQPGHYDFSAYEELLDSLDRYGLHALFILDYGNPLYDSGYAPRSAQGVDAFSRWAASAASRLGGRGILWEMWNEPNIGFWKPHPDTQAYIRLALATGRALKKAAPAEAYIGPATSGLPPDFLEACFRAGLLNYWDAVSVHPYRQNGPETAAPTLTKLRALMARYAPKGKDIPLLSGEWGYSSAWKGFDERRQGIMLARELLSNLRQGLALSIWYDWHDDGTDPREPEHHFGTVGHAYHPGRDPVYDPKPAYRAAQTLTRSLGGFRFDRRLPSDTGDYILLFRRGRERRIAAWTTGKPHRVTLPAWKGSPRLADVFGAPLPAPERSGKDLQLSLSQSPCYLIPAGKKTD